MLFKHLLVRGFAFVFAGIISQGCSNNFVTAVSPTTYSSNQSPEYFPLDEGFRSTYQITSVSASPATVSYTVGKSVPFQNGSATEWIKFQNNLKDTSYFVVDGSLLVFYEKKKAAPEIILDLPLAVGKTWSRFGDLNSGLGDTNAIDDGIVVKDSSQGGGASLASSFPTNGQAMMLVDKVESIELSNGRYYSGVYRVSNDTGAGTKNYYWYAPGIGLIKYVLGGTNSQNPSGGITGELINYGFVY